MTKSRIERQYLFCNIQLSHDEAFCGLSEIKVDKLKAAKEALRIFHDLDEPSNNTNGTNGTTGTNGTNGTDGSNGNSTTDNNQTNTTGNGNSTQTNETTGN